MDLLELEEESSRISRRQPRKKQRLTTTSSSSTPETLPPPLVLSPELGEEEDSEGSDEEEASDGEVEVEEEERTENENENENQQERMEEDLINQQAVVTEKLSNDRKHALTLSDPDVLDCPICFDVLKIPVYQCENGHIACASCFLNINNKCPTCYRPIGHNRCRAIEKVLEAVEVSCGNIKYGCEYMMKYCGDRAHESSCIYSPCFCPMDDCDFVDSAWNLYEHIHVNHSTTNFCFNCRFTVFLDISKTRLLLREETVGTSIFVLNNFLADDARVLSVVLIAPKSHMRKYLYELEAKDEEETSTLTLQSPVESHPKLADDHQPTRCLVVNFINRPPGTLELDICIRQHGC